MSNWLAALPAAVTEASDRIAPYIHRTPVVRAHWLDGLDVQLKAEHLQHTGSFKLRGALNRMLTLPESDRQRGVIAASTGNHGQGIALASRTTGIPATVYVPATAEAVKIDPMRAMGVAVETVPGDGLAAELAARAAAARTGRTFISPYNDPWVIAGQGTIGLELHAAIEKLDAVFVSVGGGGLISGIGGYLKSVQPGIRIVGCWPANAPAMSHCMAAGEAVVVPETATLSDGTAGGVEDGAITVTSCQTLIDEQVLVSEAEIGQAMRLLAVNERWIVEGAAGVALAGCLSKMPEYSGARVAVVLCGRNIALDRFLTAIEEQHRA